MSEEKIDTPPSYKTFELLLKMVQTLVLIGILVALAFLTYHITSGGGIPVTITGDLPGVAVDGVVSISPTNNGLAITNLGQSPFNIKSSTV
jgi:hypothetical protein